MPEARLLPGANYARACCRLGIGPRTDRLDKRRYGFCVGRCGWCTNGLRLFLKLERKPRKGPLFSAKYCCIGCSQRPPLIIRPRKERGESYHERAQSKITSLRSRDLAACSVPDCKQILNLKLWVRSTRFFVAGLPCFAGGFSCCVPELVTRPTVGAGHRLKTN